MKLIIKMENGKEYDLNTEKPGSEYMMNRILAQRGGWAILDDPLYPSNNGRTVLIPTCKVASVRAAYQEDEDQFKRMCLIWLGMKE